MRHPYRKPFNRPEAANSLNATVAAEMMDAVVRYEDDADIRALVLSGAGRFFCAGADLKGFIPQEANSRAESRSFTRPSRVLRGRTSR